MAEQCHFISEVDSTKTQWRLKVRVVRVWEVPCFDNKAETNNLEMVFADSQESDLQWRLEQNDIVELKDSGSDSVENTPNKTPTKRSYVCKGDICESENEILYGKPSTQTSSNKIRRIVKQEKE
ncbi:Uncharacterized protein Fot_24670 [Forsythia ovata]|uniref:Replication protein A 70 kDa DNA-binding subunit B/D first OB fold domain-containing protein n=1 Tax=Forsythia ovata TaxID=205694 RepID=A0ABD1U6V3_9LAMI